MADLAIPQPSPLPSKELFDLLECEASIERAASAMLDAGVGLRRIKELKLYRAVEYATWEAYCATRLGWSPQHANRIIEAAKIMEELRLQSEPTGSLLPESERQVRPLAAVPAPARAEVWAAPPARQSAAPRLVERARAQDKDVGAITSTTLGAARKR